MPDFLLEIGCEEIPARMIEAASAELRERVSELLNRERLQPAGACDLPRYSAPPGRACHRRCSLATGCRRRTDSALRTKVAYKDGQPTPAAHAFAKKAGVDVSQLETRHDPQRANI